MDRPQYCVYNQTNECFLSLGVALYENVFARLKRIRGRIGQRFDEGVWITMPRGVQTLDIFSARDLIYLDSTHKVLCVIESFPAFRLAPRRHGTASILALPIRTIHSSQTQPGNQLVICVAKEMEFRLRSGTSRSMTNRSKTSHGLAESGAASVSSASAGVKSWLPQGIVRNRQGAMCKRWPRMVAYDAAGDSLPVHGIRDISSTGLYLVTKERWPLGSHVRMSLQRMDAIDDDPNTPITIELHVVRWGADGVGLDFLQAGMEHAALVSMDMQ